MKNKRYMFLNTEQHSTLLRCLVEFKNDLVRQGRTADIVDEVILKVMNAPVKKVKSMTYITAQPLIPKE